MIFEAKGENRCFFLDVAFVEKARSHDDSRYNMCGINVEHEDGKVFLVATNGHFLNFVEYSAVNAPKLEEGFHTVRRCTKDMIILEKEDLKYAGMFVAWRKVVPEHNDIVVKKMCISDDKKYNYSFCKLIYILNNLGCFINHAFITISFLNSEWDIYVDPKRVNGTVMLKSQSVVGKAKYTTVIQPLKNDCHAIMSNALSKFDNLESVVNKDNLDFLFADSIHKKARPLFEI
jgi:hypothetical protein